MRATVMYEIYLIAFASLALACSSEPNGSASTNTFGGNTGAGAAGASLHGGSVATSSGGASSGNGGQSPNSGGMSGTGAAVATGGANGGTGHHDSGGTAAIQTGGSSGSAPIGGNPDSGGTTSSGGAPGSAGAGGGGMAQSGGGDGVAGATAGGASAGGATAGGANGDGELASVAKALDRLRIDDGCAGTPDTSDGAVCMHTMLTNNQFRASKEVAITGTAGVTYDVTLRIRGVVEPASVDGGTRPDTTTFSYKDATWRRVPYTIGGTVKAPDYEQWHLRVTSPAQDYYFNDYQKNGHFVFKLDYQVTIPMAANTKVTFECYDSNEREIVNYEGYAVEGIPGSVNHGQFVQLDVISVKAR